MLWIWSLWSFSVLEGVYRVERALVFRHPEYHPWPHFSIYKHFLEIHSLMWINEIYEPQSVSMSLCHWKAVSLWVCAAGGICKCRLCFCTGTCERGTQCVSREGTVCEYMWSCIWMSECVNVVTVCIESALPPVMALTHPLVIAVALGRRWVRCGLISLKYQRIVSVFILVQ